VTALGGEMVDDTESEARECAYLGGTITDGSLEEVTRIDVPKGAILTFLRQILSTVFMRRWRHPM
jgi:hypothetical protein